MSRIPMPPQLPQGSFLVTEAAVLGLTQKQLRRSGIFAPSRGIRLPLHSRGSVADNVRAYSQLDPRSVLTHSTSARICSICLPGWLDQDWRIHVARPADGWKPRRRNVVGHQLSFKEGEVVMFDGVRITAPARTWLDLASILSVDELVVAGDSIVNEHSPDFPFPKEPLATIEDLRRIIQEHPGMRGVRRARTALELIRCGADSAPETTMRLAMMYAGLPEPILNVVLRDGMGYPVLWPDAAYPEQRIAIQYDGAHHGDPEQYRRDIKRLAVTEALGWREVRIQQSDLEGDRPFVVEKIRSVLRKRTGS